MSIDRAEGDEAERDPAMRHACPKCGAAMSLLDAVCAQCGHRPPPRRTPLGCLSAVIGLGFGLGLMLGISLLLNLVMA